MILPEFWTPGLVVCAALCVFAAMYSVFGIGFSVWHLYQYKTRGPFGYANLLNRRFAGNKHLVVLEYVSYAATVAWFLLMIPWFDLLTIQVISQTTSRGITTYFGPMSGEVAQEYSIIALFSAIGAGIGKALSEVASELRHRRILQVSLLLLRSTWSPEDEF